ncbi:helix-turn-helix transcriptional regulator [Streptomyces coelicoflavus]|uniref:HTH-type transcriptional regulator RipA n=1 Tax=Streptomyces coelicoflavus TaxID=285562 RepID=A0A6N9UM27_9ACTN|nr:helix-turn-helix transcriptional regulator [Streptomyces coelicoflavus]
MCRTGTHRAVPARAGRTSSGVACSPQGPITAETIRGRGRNRRSRRGRTRPCRCGCPGWRVGRPGLIQVISHTSAPEGQSDEQLRLRAVLLDQLRLAPQQPLHLPAPSTPLLTEVCDMLRSDPADGRSLAELGRQVGTSERTLSRMIRRDLGMSFTQWRTQMRLHHALVLLSEKTPVTSVAHQCGWSSASTFIDVFRRTFGHTPGSHHNAV